MHEAWENRMCMESKECTRHGRIGCVWKGKSARGMGECVYGGQSGHEAKGMCACEGAECTRHAMEDVCI